MPRMNRVPLTAASLVLASAAVAVAGEYAPEAPAQGYVAVPTPTLANPHPAILTTLQIGPLEAQVTRRNVRLPFEFPYFGKLYREVAISVDGWLAFGNVTPDRADNPELASDDAKSAGTPRAVVAALWDDLRTSKHGSVVTFVTGARPSREFIVAWQHMDTAARATADDVSFEVVLHEKTGVIDILYDTTSANTTYPGRWRGLSYTVGIENPEATHAFPVDDAGGFPVAATNTNDRNDVKDVSFQPAGVSFHGTVLREDDDRPVAGATVAVLLHASQEVIAKALTDDAGKYSIPPLGLVSSTTTDLDLELLASDGQTSVVKDRATGTVWSSTFAVGRERRGDQDLGVFHLKAGQPGDDADFRKALNIEQAAHRGFTWARIAVPTVPVRAADPPRVRQIPLELPEIAISFVPGLDAKSGYDPKTTSAPAFITIADKPNADAYDDDVVLRETAQHVLATLAVFAGKITDHQWVILKPAPVLPPLPQPPVPSPLSQPTAFADGFSFWFAAAVQGRSTFSDAGGTTSAFDLETPTPAVTGTEVIGSGPAVTGAVAATLWDLVDPAGETDATTGQMRDTFARTLPATGYDVLKALDQRVFDELTGTYSFPSGSAAPTARSFFDTWRASRSGSEPSQTARVFIFNGTLADDANEADDTAADLTPAKNSIASGTTKSGLTLNPSNEDRFLFTLGAKPVSVVVTFADATGAGLSIVDRSDPEVVIATSASAGSPIVVNVTPGVDGAIQGAAYVVRLAWTFGPTATYTVTLSTKPQLVPLTHAAWTAGVRYEEVLNATDGVLDPVHGAGKYRFTLDAPVPPGMRIDAGNRLTGTPEKPGHYTLHVLIADDSGDKPTPQLVTFDVNEPLVLPPYFGVVAGSSVSVDVGHGGTGAVWTKSGEAPVASGFTLSDGASLALQLTGASDSKPFTVAGFAADAVTGELVGDMTAVPSEPATSQIVVSPRVSRGPLTQDAEPAFIGFAIDAVSGSDATVRVDFTGLGKASPPRLVDVIDDEGTHVAHADRGGRTLVTTFVAPRTSTYFVVFKQTGASGVSGSKAVARAHVSPPRRFTGITNVVNGTDPVPPKPPLNELVRFTGGKGSTARVVLRGGSVPHPAVPGLVHQIVIRFVQPSALPGADPVVIAGVISNPQAAPDDALRKTFDIGPLPESGEYVLFVPADVTTSGSLAAEVVVDPNPAR